MRAYQQQQREHKQAIHRGYVICIRPKRHQRKWGVPTAPSAPCYRRPGLHASICRSSNEENFRISSTKTPLRERKVGIEFVYTRIFTAYLCYCSWS